MLPLLCAFLLLLTGCTGGPWPLPVQTASAGERDDVPPAGEKTPEAPGEPEPAAQPPEEDPPGEEPYVRVVDPALPMVALTFDDGPHEVYTNQILDILEENHAVATFFEVGRNVAAYPDALPRMVELGCEYGSHSYAHRNLSKLSWDELVEDIRKTDAAFTDAGVAPPNLLRPPYGAVNRSVMYHTGRAVITWSVDTEDWKSRDTETVVNYVKGLKKLDGQVVLLHSLYESTVEAARELVPWLMEEGYQLVTVTELMAYYYGEVPAANKSYGYTFLASHKKTEDPAAVPEIPWTPLEPTPPPAPVQPPAVSETPSDGGAVPEGETPPAGSETPPEEGTPPESETSPAGSETPPEDETSPARSEPPPEEGTPPEGETPPTGDEPPPEESAVPGDEAPPGDSETSPEGDMAGETPLAGETDPGEGEIPSAN